MSRTMRAAAWLPLLLGALSAGCAEGTTLVKDGAVDDAASDAVVDSDPVGYPCITDADCPESGMSCLTVYASYAEPDVGMIIPRAYCTYTAECATDEACGPGAGCWRPLDGVPQGELDTLGFDYTPLVDFGQCLMACEGDDDCGEGFVCQKPLLRALDLPSAPDRRFCVFDDTPTCDEAVKTPAAGTCTLTYELAGNFQITHTPLGAGDQESPIGPGVLVVEVPSVSKAPASSGAARVKCFEMEQRMEVQGIHTAVRASFANPESATGALAGGALTFDDCDYAATRGDSSTSWTIDAPASGPGCLEQYASRGAVFCTAFCSTGGLSAGSNPQNNVWTQPFNTLIFENGIENVAMRGATDLDPGLGGDTDLLVDGQIVDACSESSCPYADEAVEVPNENPSRTWLSFTGTRVETRCAD